MTAIASLQRMSHLKRVSYCFCIAVVVTALASLFYAKGGELLAVPGMIISGFLTVVGFEFKLGGDFGPDIPWQFASVFLYAIVFYGISWVYTGLREEREEARAQANDTVRPAN
jgi:hypothetical protein